MPTIIGVQSTGLGAVYRIAIGGSVQYDFVTDRRGLVRFEQRFGAGKGGRAVATAAETGAAVVVADVVAVVAAGGVAGVVEAGVADRLAVRVAPTGRPSAAAGRAAARTAAAGRSRRDHRLALLLAMDDRDLLSILETPAGLPPSLLSQPKWHRTASLLCHHCLYAHQPLDRPQAN
jgi:hypothetical protein